MILQSEDGHERGHCDDCRDIYDTREDADAGLARCGRCVRARRKFIEEQRKAQALSILETLERIPPCQQLRLVRTETGEWLVWLQGEAPHAGDDLTEALGQLCQVMISEAPPMCERCADNGKEVPATSGRYCEACHDTLGELQAERAAREQ